MDNLVRVKYPEFTRRRLERGFRHEKDLADEMGMARQHLNSILNKDNAEGITLGVAFKICRGLSTPEEPCIIEDIFEFILD
jgi:DNA-binding Xre family transcriptional regulator